MRAVLLAWLAAGGLRYLFFAALALAGPGAAVQCLLRLPVDPALVLPLGVAFVAGAHWLGLVTGLPVLPAAALALDVLLVVHLVRRRLAVADGPSLKGAIPACTAVVLFLALTMFGGNRTATDGSFLLDPLVAYDTAFHVGLSHELTFTAAPEVPGLAGVPLGYHLGTDLVRAAALVLAGVSPYDSVSRFDVTAYAVALVLLLRSVTARLGGSPLAVAFAGFTPLLGDLAWMLGADARTTWWTDLLRGNLLVSLALANPVLPALGLLLAALVALDRARDGGTRPLVLAAMAAGAVPFFKVFLGAHLLLGLGVAFLLCAPWRRRLVAVALPCTLATAALVLGQGGEPVRVSLQPLDLVRTTALHVSGDSPTGLRLALLAVPWLLLSLGPRLLGLPAALRALRSGAPAGAALAAMALAAWPLGLLFHVSAPVVLPGQPVVNDAAYLVEQGGPLLWIFTALAVGTATGRRAVVVACALAALALPDTGQFVQRKIREGFDPVPAPRVRAMTALREASAPGDVVLQRPGARYPALPVVLAGRRVTYERFTPWLTQFAPPELLTRRHEAVHRFFRTRDRADAALIARGLGARWLCLYDSDRIRFDVAEGLQAVHAEPGASCFRLALDAPVTP